LQDYFILDFLNISMKEDYKGLMGIEHGNLKPGKEGELLLI
jgi:hypothetical protein